MSTAGRKSAGHATKKTSAGQLPAVSKDARTTTSLKDARISATQAKSKKVDAAPDVVKKATTPRPIKLSSHLTTPGLIRIMRCGGIMRSTRRQPSSTFAPGSISAANLVLRPGDPEVFKRYNDITSNPDAIRLTCDILSTSLLTSAAIAVALEKRCTLQNRDFNDAAARHGLNMYGSHILPKKLSTRPLSGAAAMKQKLAADRKAKSAAASAAAE